MTKSRNMKLAPKDKTIRHVITAEDFDFGDNESVFVNSPPAKQPLERLRLGEYLVIHEGETPQQRIAESFENFDEALAFARGRWGYGEYLKLEMPDGTAYDFGGGVRERINLIRMREGVLDPRQQLLLEKWLVHHQLQGCERSLRKYATAPSNIYEMLDEGGRMLLIEALSCGLLEIIDWTDGGPFPDREWVDKYLEAGRARSI